MSDLPLVRTARSGFVRFEFEILCGETLETRHFTADAMDLLFQLESTKDRVETDQEWVVLMRGYLAEALKCEPGQISIVMAQDFYNGLLGYMADLSQKKRAEMRRTLPAEFLSEETPASENTSLPPSMDQEPSIGTPEESSMRGETSNPFLPFTESTTPPGSRG